MGIQEQKSPDEGEGAGVMNDRTDRVRTEGRHIAEEARELAADVNELVEESTDFLRDQAIQRPYVTLASAFGAGYVLGGGVPLWAVRALIAVGGKMAVSAIVTELGKAAAPRETDRETND